MVMVNSNIPRAARRRPAQANAEQKPWFRIESKAGAGEATVYIYDIIDSWWGVGPKAFVDELNAIDADTVRVRLNSPGGDVFDAIAIHTALKAHDARIVIHVDGVAASAASLIAMAGDEIRMAKGSFLMIHNPWTFAMGDSGEIREVADLLDKVAASMAGMYSDRSRKSKRAMRSIMDAETWYTAEEAHEEGFADAVEGDEPKTKAAAHFDLSMYARVPEPLLNGRHPEAEHETEQPERRVETIRDFEALLRDAGGFSREQAKAIAAHGYRATAEPREEAGGSPDDADDTAVSALLEEIGASLMATRIRRTLTARTR